MHVNAKYGKWSKGGIDYSPRVFASFEGIGKTRPRNVPALAPNCLELNYDALARHLQSIPSAHTFFFSGAVLGLERGLDAGGDKINNTCFFKCFLV